MAASRSVRRLAGPEARDVFRYAPGDVRVGDIGDTRYMRGGDDPGCGQKTRSRIERLLGKYIERRARQMSSEEPFHQRILADQALPRWIDDARPRGKQCDFALTDDMARLGILWQTEEQVLSPFEKAFPVFVAPDPLQTKTFSRGLVRRGEASDRQGAFRTV